MGTFAKISLKENNKELIQKAFTTIKNIENSLSSYNKNSDISRLNEKEEVSISLYTKEILDLCEKYYKETNGYFNIAIGSITKDLYRFGENERVPTSKELHNSNTDITNITHLVNTYKLKNGIKIDLGGVGKGFGVDKASDFLKENGVKSGKIQLSGDIRCFETCKVKITSPFNTKKIFATFNTKYANSSISTSGTYRRYVKTQKNHHLINPKTKKQENNFLSVTLVTLANNSKIDAYATAISVMPKNLAINFLKKQKEIAYIVITPDGELLKGNFKDLVLNFQLIK
ncbi:MAG: FAD:protein FMN transferase [Helicobacteraceae bacterium]|nr:FAD:protein FMN transferase [Helicobacteraceae bacterium]